MGSRRSAPRGYASIAAELLENGEDTPALRRLAGEMRVSCRADVEEIVKHVFKEFWVSYPISETQAQRTLTRQIAGEVIHGDLNAWAAASNLEIMVWGRKAENTDLQTIFDLRDQLNWDNTNRGQIPTLTIELELFRKLCRPEFCRYPTHSAEKRGMDGARKFIAKAKML